MANFTVDKVNIEINRSEAYKLYEAIAIYNKNCIEHGSPPQLPDIFIFLQDLYNFNYNEKLEAACRKAINK